MTEPETPYRLEVRRSAIEGSGCFAAEPIPADGLVGEYTGELITTAEALKRELDPSRPVLLTFEIDKDWTLDGQFGGNITIYINHSCDPNCYVEIDTAAQRIFIRAKRAIAVGEELTFDYAFDPHDPLEVCLCGSPKCRGYLNDIQPSDAARNNRAAS